MLFLTEEMGLGLKLEHHLPGNFSKKEIADLTKCFNELDSENKGYITVQDLNKYFKVFHQEKIDTTLCYHIEM